MPKKVASCEVGETQFMANVDVRLADGLETCTYKRTYNTPPEITVFDKIKMKVSNDEYTRLYLNVEIVKVYKNKAGYTAIQSRTVGQEQ